jgi:hypothetical protein
MPPASETAPWQLRGCGRHQSVCRWIIWRCAAVAGTCGGWAEDGHRMGTWRHAAAACQEAAHEWHLYGVNLLMLAQQAAAHAARGNTAWCALNQGTDRAAAVAQVAAPAASTAVPDRLSCVRPGWPDAPDSTVARQPAGAASCCSCSCFRPAGGSACVSCMLEVQAEGRQTACSPVSVSTTMCRTLMSLQ